MHIETLCNHTCIYKESYDNNQISRMIDSIALSFSAIFAH